MKHLLCVSMLALIVGCSAQTNQTLPSDVVKSIEQRIENGTNPSVAVAIVDKAGTYYFNFGTVSKGGAKVNEHSIYEIGSITKVFTGILLAKNVVEGKMKLEDPIKNYLPSAVTVPVRGSQEITLGHLSDHTSGLPRMPDNFTPANPANPFADYTVDQMFSFLSKHSLGRDVGQGYEYSNFAQGLLGHILATKAGTSYEDLVIKTIAKPLGMNETKITLDDQMKKNLALPHSNGEVVENWDITSLAGAGAIRSSTSDMLKFLAANMGLKKTDLQAAMLRSHEVRHDKPGGGMRVGLGWHIAKGSDGDVIWHNGGTGGYRTFAGFVKETGKGVVVFTNSSIGVDDIGFHLLNPGSPLANIKPSISREVAKAIQAKGIEAGIAKYHELKQKNPNDYDFSESALNDLGYSYMKSDVKAALAIFKLNIDLFPSSSNVYDSYAEALVTDGQKELAIENYKKSVDMNPASQGGIEALKKLGVTYEAPAVEVTAETLQTYVGTYQLAPNFNIAITREGKQLYAQATGQGRFELFPRKANEFYLKIVDAQVTFNVEGNGSVPSLTLHQNGQHIPGKRIN